MNAITRDMTKEDTDLVVLMASEMVKESHYSAFSFNPYKVKVLVDELIDQPYGIAFVVEVGGEVVGGFIGQIGQHFFGDHLMSFDYGLYLMPEFRKSRIGLQIVQEYIRRAKEKGVDEIRIGNSTGYESERVEAMYEHLGFIRRGGNFHVANVKGE